MSKPGESPPSPLPDPESADSAEPVVIPHAELSTEALQGVVESFVLREGTDYGERDFSLEQKVQHVLQQLHAGRARIVFDPASETVSIVTEL